MIVLVVFTLALCGATTWSALEQPLARDPAFHHRLTGAGLVLSLVAIAVMAAAAVMAGGT